MKPSKLRPKQELSRTLYSYTDETGNTGMNLFDSAQPDFWTGTLVTPTNLDTLPSDIHRAVLSRAEAAELHANAMGLKGIEKIAGKLITLLMRYQAKFFFTKLDKSHYAALKFADTLLDNGLNKAVSAFHYGHRFNRLYFAHILCALLDETDRRQFWKAYLGDRAADLLAVLNRVRPRLAVLGRDKRTEQILADALDWGIKHPAELLEGRQDGLSSPNVAAVGLVVQMLHRLHEGTGAAIATFVHDEQKQFGTFLKDVYDYTKGHTARDGSHPLSFISDVKTLPTFVGQFEAKRSDQSFGLQLVDVALWLVKRFLAGPEAMKGMSRELAIWIISEARVSSLDHQTLAGEVERGFDYLDAVPFGPAEEASARSALAEIEKSRVESIHSTDE